MSSDGTLAEMAASNILKGMQVRLIALGSPLTLLWSSSTGSPVIRFSLDAVNTIRFAAHLTANISHGICQNEEMDRFGIVAIREDLTVEHLKDGPLPCEDGLEALCQAVLAAGGVEPHIGELDFQASGPWRHGYYHAPAFGLFSQDRVLCSVQKDKLVMPDTSFEVADVAGVGVRLSVRFHGSSIC